MSAPAVSTLGLCAIEADLEMGGRVRPRFLRPDGLRLSPVSRLPPSSPDQLGPGFRADVAMVGIHETGVDAVGS